MQQSSEIRVGVFVIAVVALGLLAAGFLKGGFGGRASGYSFEIWFEEAPQIGKGSPLRLAGVDVGQVVDKDILQVTEQVTVRVTPGQSALPYELVTRWIAGKPGTRDYRVVDVGTRRLAAGEVTPDRSYSRTRSVARLAVKVHREFELFTHYRFQISGGVVFGDKMLNVLDTGPDGLPLAADERGESLAKGSATRVMAVLGQPPTNLDAIAGNVQRIMDEETTLRVKQIIANIDRATEEAGEMLAAVRATIQANQSNADTMMKNLAAGSAELKAGLGETRLALGRTLSHVEATTEVAQRLAQHNEARLNHVVGNIDDLTGRFDQMARDNQGRVNTMMANAESVSRQLNDTVAKNRANLDTMVEQATQTTRNLNHLSADARERLGSTMGKIDETVGRVNDATGQMRDLMRDSDGKLRNIIGNASAMTDTMRGTLESIKADLPEITDHLKSGSKNIADATAKMKDLIGDPSVKATMHNAESLTAEAKSLIEDIRRMTADPQLQDNVKATTAALRHTAEKVDKALSGASSFRPSATVTSYYVPQTSHFESDVDLAIGTKGRASYFLGAADVTVKPRWTAEMGRSLLSDEMRLRYGFYRGKLGAGLDYSGILKGLRVQADFYDPKRLYLNTRFYYDLPLGVTAVAGFEDVFHNFDWLMGFQIGHHLP